MLFTKYYYFIVIYLLLAQNENMHEDIRDYQRQLEAQRETMVTTRDEDAKHHDRLESKNCQLNEALDQNEVSDWWKLISIFSDKIVLS